MFRHHRYIYSHRYIFSHRVFYSASHRVVFCGLCDAADLSDVAVVGAVRKGTAREAANSNGHSTVWIVFKCVSSTLLHCGGESRLLCQPPPSSVDSALAHRIVAARDGTNSSSRLSLDDDFVYTASLSLGSRQFGVADNKYAFLTRRRWYTSVRSRTSLVVDSGPRPADTDRRLSRAGSKCERQHRQWIIGLADE